MSELENEVVEQQPAPDAEVPEVVDVNQEPEGEKKPSIFKKVLGKIKEWCRKQVVTLKRMPQRIPIAYQAIVTFIYLVWLFDYSRIMDSLSGVEWIGIAVFLATLISILVLPMLLNSFPKRKKPSIVFLILVFVFMAAIILADVLYYVQISNFVHNDVNEAANFLGTNPPVQKALTLAIAHMVLQGISIVLLATMPLYAKLIRKINTRKDIAASGLAEEIDTSEEEA